MFTLRLHPVCTAPDHFVRQVPNNIMGNKVILLEIRSTKEVGGQCVRRRDDTNFGEAVFGGAYSGPDRDGETAAPAGNEN